MKIKILCSLLLLGVIQKIYGSEIFFKIIPSNVQVEELHAQPPIFLVRNFVSEHEVEHIKKIALNRLVPSRIGKNRESAYRTSSSVELPHDENKYTQKIAERAAQMVGYPASHVELQVVRYQKGEQYRQHWDYFPADALKIIGSQRIYTFFVYLSDVPSNAQGGTHFPKLDLTIQPQKCAAAVWRNVDNKKKPDERMLHAGLPLLQCENNHEKCTEKWGMNIWIHDKPYIFPPQKT